MKSSQLTIDDLSFSASAQYKAVTEVGSFGADVTGKAYWKTYLQASQGHTYVEVSGGLDDKISALQQAFDPDNPSSVSVSRFTDWAKSITEEPGIVDFKLSPIWDLCGDKRDVVQQAWELYAAKMRPRLTMEVSSSKTDDITVRKTDPPVIVLNGRQIKPLVRPDTSWGYQVLILDGSHLADQSGILFNQYFSAGSFGDAYRNLYPKIYDAITNSGHIDDGNVLILASYGLDQNLPPYGDIYGLLQSAGAGKVIKQWVQSSDPGSEDDGDWGVAEPATYFSWAPSEVASTLGSTSIWVPGIILRHRSPTELPRISTAKSSRVPTR